MSGATARFDAIHDPLAWLEATARDRHAVRWMSDRELCVGDPGIARSLLANEQGLLVRHSDFFGPIERALSPRTAQVSLARACLQLLQRHVETIDVANAVAALPRRGEWPRTANLLVLEMMRPVLAAPTRSPAFHAALDRLVANRILSRYAKPKGRLARIAERFRFANAVLREADRARASAPAGDILDILVETDRGVSPDSVIHLYTAFVFALASSVGLSLAWAVLLAVRHEATTQRGRDIVREAMRLYPVAWLLERRPSVPQEVAAEHVAPPQVMLISPYVVHRWPGSWPRPGEFAPQRWSQRVDHRAWIPFGTGAQSCIAAALSLRLLTELVTAILARPMSIELVDEHPSIGPALAPPRFILHRG
jgi:cytochrome P450